MLKLAVLKNCRSDSRFKKWQDTGGALLGRKDLGCGLNSLAFLSVFTRREGEFLIQSIKPTGTSFLEIMNFVTRLNGYQTDFIPISVDISTPFHVTVFFNELHQQMPENSCTIAKLMRNPNINERPYECRNLTIGHSLIFSKEGDKIYTIDPQQGTKRERNDEKIIRSFQRNCYTSVLLVGTVEKRRIIKKSNFNLNKDEDLIKSTLKSINLDEDGDVIMADYSKDRDGNTIMSSLDEDGDVIMAFSRKSKTRLKSRRKSRKRRSKSRHKSRRKSRKRRSKSRHKSRRKSRKRRSKSRKRRSKTRHKSRRKSRKRRSN